ncbi:MAG: hypothetical protein M1823_000289 [Watsoniomyces obsoletus]|nr:MAG: hypothetical protein M1823_000289 [Watsoniomyces obsoletus]
MMRRIDAITDKPRWRDQIHDEEIQAEWRKEFHLANFLTDSVPISDRMFKRVFDELHYHAYITNDEEFHVDPSYVSVGKADIPLPENQALRRAVRPLEDVPDHAKDWRPGSKEKVLDLVHPSLFQLIAGHSRVIPDREGNEDPELNMTTLLNLSGGGTVLDGWEVDARWVCPNGVLAEHTELDMVPVLSSKRYQWLPAEVRLDQAHGRLQTRFTSIINNLHPTKHRPLYEAIEAILARCVPLWDRVLAETRDDFATPQIEQHGDSTYCTSLRCKKFDLGPQYEDEPSDDEDEDALEEWLENRVPVQPDVAPFVAPKRKPTPGILSSCSRFQVIVKLVNIELGPDKERYGGESWQFQGQLNERIRASALHYYDEHNVTPGRLAFRQISTELESYDYLDKNGLRGIFGFEDGMPLLQELGSVSTRQHRLLAFSNMFQYKIHPFRLTDPTKRGWRKILGLFLVDPTIRITSTATVPPQQQDWWKPMFMRIPPFTTLPPEICELIFSFVDFPMTLENAKEERLMFETERSVA